MRRVDSYVGRHRRWSRFPDRSLGVFAFSGQNPTAAAVFDVWIGRRASGRSTAQGWAD
jgi:hypothetical protein